MAFGASGGGSTAAPAVDVLARRDGRPLDDACACRSPTTCRRPAWPGSSGTVTAVGDGTVTLDVSKWYAGGDADQVVLSTADLGLRWRSTASSSSQGGEYLVAVLDGQVLTCGLSGPADPVLAAIYDGWFAG